MGRDILRRTQQGDSFHRAKRNAPIEKTPASAGSHSFCVGTDCRWRADTEGIIYSFGIYARKKFGTRRVVEQLDQAQTWPGCCSLCPREETKANGNYKNNPTI